jgi:hypothetical protein
VRDAPHRTRELLGELHALAEEIEESLLSLASDAARVEWRSLRDAWPSEIEVRRGVVGLAEDDLEWMVSKVKRFRQILRALAGAPRTPAAPIVVAPAVSATA